MAALTIRAAETSDLDAITAIYDDAVRNGTASYELDPPGREEMERRYVALLEGGFPYLAALGGGDTDDEIEIEFEYIDRSDDDADIDDDLDDDLLDPSL